MAYGIGTDYAHGERMDPPETGEDGDADTEKGDQVTDITDRARDLADKLRATSRHYNKLIDWEEHDLSDDEADALILAELQAVAQAEREAAAGLARTLRDIRDNWDCDEDAHKYGTTCRCCQANDTLLHYDAAILSGQNTSQKRPISQVFAELRAEYGAEFDAGFPNPGQSASPKVPSVTEIRSNIGASEKYLEAAAPLQEAQAVQGECHWHETEYYWLSECGLEWVLEDAAPAANGMIYCPKCGRKLIDDSEEHRDVDD